MLATRFGQVTSPTNAVLGERYGPTIAYVLLVAGALYAATEDFVSVDRVPAYRDLLFFVLPFKHFLGEQLRHGHLPLWNPWIYLGTPFLGSLQSGVGYPPSLLLLLPFPLGFNVFLIFHFIVAAIGSWRLSRARNLSTPACAIGALTFSLGGYLVSMINVTNHLQAAVWLPWGWLYWIRYLERRRSGDLTRFVVLIAILVLAGAPEILLMAIALLGAWTGLSSPVQWSYRPRLLGTLGLLLALGMSLVAFQILPTAEYIGQSNRGSALSLEEVTTWSLRPISLLQLLLPPASGLTVTAWILSIYLGVVPLALSIHGAIVGKERRFWVCVILAATFLSFGSATPILPALYEAFPGLVGKLRYPEKFYFLVHLAASVLAAEGAEACFRSNHSRTGHYSVIVLGLIVSIGVVLLFGAAATSDLGWECTRGIVLLGCSSAVLALSQRSIIGLPTAALMVVGLVATDLASTAHGLNQTVSWSALRREAPIVDVEDLGARRSKVFLYQTESNPAIGTPAEPIQGLEQWIRVRQTAANFEDAAGAVWRAMPFDIPMVYGVGTLSGADGIMRSSDLALRVALSSASHDRAVKLLRVFGVTWLVGPVPLPVPSVELVGQAGRPPMFVYRVDAPVPAAYLASRVREAGDDGERGLERLTEPDFVPGVDAIVEDLPPAWPETSAAETAGDVQALTWANERVELAVHARRPALLVLNDSFFPGWEARVDGDPVRIHRANRLVKGIFVDGGDHRVELVYRPWSFRLGMVISTTTLAAWGIVIVLRRRRATAASQPVAPRRRTT